MADGDGITLNRFRRFNDKLADKMSDSMSAMGLFWLLTVLIWSTILFQRPQGAQGWILFLVSVFFQGVGLIVVNYTSAKQGRMMLQLLQETHDTVMAELASVRDLLSTERQIVSGISMEDQELAKLTETLQRVTVATKYRTR